ncbi:hypothetical protein NDU88_006104 [Pleurodeles waltl]|uniref:LINE-1 type transposase domain-containing protein 1 n=1 Tax=Pleurodeles waltl TaxID=8319 RepID=A0AAV7RQX1_PLEWA|nr:hypothetical protein NDU88_006104 [Pleurodeles waltl]
MKNKKTKRIRNQEDFEDQDLENQDQKELKDRDQYVSARKSGVQWCLAVGRAADPVFVVLCIPDFIGVSLLQLGLGHSPDLGTSHQGSGVALEGKIEPVAVQVNLLRADLWKVSDKVKVAEGSIVELQTEVGALRKQMVQANSTVGRLEARLEDPEGRSGRNNVRLLGFLECAEGSAAEAFVKSWIRDVLQPTGLSRVFVVERAHRALIAPPRPGSPPRANIASLLNYKDRDCVLRAARESDKAIYENCKISIYPDYTNKVQSSRKRFMEVKANLCTMNIRYMLLNPARLKVLSGGRSHFFDRPKEVWRWLEMWDKEAPGRLEGTGEVSLRASGAESPDWRSHEAGRLEDAGTSGPAVDSTRRVEIQQDGTMGVVPAGLAGGLDVEPWRGAGGSLRKSDYDLHDSGCRCTLACGFLPVFISLKAELSHGHTFVIYPEDGVGQCSLCTSHKARQL